MAPAAIVCNRLHDSAATGLPVSMGWHLGCGMRRAQRTAHSPQTSCCPQSVVLQESDNLLTIIQSQVCAQMPAVLELQMLLTCPSRR